MEVFLNFQMLLLVINSLAEKELLPKFSCYIQPLYAVIKMFFFIVLKIAVVQLAHMVLIDTFY